MEGRTYRAEEGSRRRKSARLDRRGKKSVSILITNSPIRFKGRGQERCTNHAGRLLIAREGRAVVRRRKQLSRILPPPSLSSLARFQTPTDPPSLPLPLPPIFPTSNILIRSLATKQNQTRNVELNDLHPHGHLIAPTSKTHSPTSSLPNISERVRPHQIPPSLLPLTVSLLLSILSSGGSRRSPGVRLPSGRLGVPEGG